MAGAVAPPDSGSSLQSGQHSKMAARPRNEQITLGVVGVADPAGARTAARFVWQCSSLPGTATSPSIRGQFLSLAHTDTHFSSRLIILMNINTKTTTKHPRPDPQPCRDYKEMFVFKQIRRCICFNYRRAPAHAGRKASPLFLHQTFLGKPTRTPRCTNTFRQSKGQTNSLGTERDNNIHQANNSHVQCKVF